GSYPRLATAISVRAWSRRVGIVQILGHEGCKQLWKGFRRRGWCSPQRAFEQRSPHVDHLRECSTSLPKRTDGPAEAACTFLLVEESLNKHERKQDAAGLGHEVRPEEGQVSVGGSQQRGYACDNYDGAQDKVNRPRSLGRRSAPRRGTRHGQARQFDSGK